MKIAVFTIKMEVKNFSPEEIYDVKRYLMTKARIRDVEFQKILTMALSQSEKDFDCSRGFQDEDK